MPPKKATPMKTDGTREFATSIVRFSVQHAHRDKIGASKEWFAVMDSIKRQPDFGYVCKGELIDDELDIVLFVAWEHAAKPPITFSENLDSIFSPLHNFLAKQPQITGTLYRIMEMDRQSTRLFGTSGCAGHINCINEFMTVRGPARAVETELKRIQELCSVYERLRCFADAVWNFTDDTFAGLQRFRLELVGDLEVTDHTGQPIGTFALLVQWGNEKGRAEFQDPNLPDSSLPPANRFADNFWQEEVMKRLEKQGASISSWIYHKAAIARDGKNKLLITEEFKNLYSY
ncbi:hypothetical protein TrVFT333_009081 [Trichoderma virens FT-333]|nr:hypothetical protein TrVFT333_009081 [Trichoderma virens FT-333]